VSDLFKVSKIKGRYRWTYQNGAAFVSNSQMQHGARECRANLQDVVFWTTRKVVETPDPNAYLLVARGQRKSNLLITPYLDGWQWRLKDDRRVYFQPIRSVGHDDPLDAFIDFEQTRLWFKALPAKATRRVIEE
jgi:hypothetical protein